MKIRNGFSLVTLALMLSAGAAMAQTAFTPGNIVVLRANNSTLSASTSASVVEYDNHTALQTTPVSQDTLPTTGTGARLTVGGSATSDGQMTLDSERIHLIIAGYDTTEGVTGLSGAAGVKRSVFSVLPSGVISNVADVTQTFAFSGNNIRSGTAAGSRYYAAGTSSVAGTNGIQLMTGATSTQITATPITNTRIVNIYNGQLYFSTNVAGLAGVYAVGTGIPATGGITSVLATTGGSGASPFGFTVSPDNNTMYVADDAAGIAKYTRTGGTGLFTFAYTVTSNPCRGLIADYSTSPFTLYAVTAFTTGTTPDSLIKIPDAGAGSSFTTLAISPSGTLFKGVAFAPSPYAMIQGGGDSICSGSSEHFRFYGNPGDSVTFTMNGVTRGVRLSNGGVDTFNTGTLTHTGPNDSVFTVSLVNIVTSLGVRTVSGSITFRVSPTGVASIAGANSVCMGSSLTLTDASTGGTWTSGSTGVATVSASGVVTPVSAGVSIITYTRINACGTFTDTQSVTVVPLPVGGTIGGSTTVCPGANITLTDAGGTAGGSWTSSATGFATVNSSGMVHGITSGTTVISYTVTNSCGTATSTYTVSVGTLPSAGTITGLTSVCTGANITLTDTSGGGAGTWTSGSTGIATVSSTGVVHGVAIGTSSISYAVTNACGTATVSYTITVNATPVAGTISGSTSVCAGSDITLTDAGGTAGGSWISSSTSLATVSSSGVVHGVSAGSVSISYSVTTACGTATTSYSVTVNPLPVAGSISGPATVCTGSNITLTDTAAGGTGSWTSSSTGVATVSASGVVHGIVAGTTLISYSVTNSCGTAITSYSVGSVVTPVAGTITGATNVCTGADITLTETGGSAGGSWVSSSTSMATVSSTGVVHGIAVGSVFISYTLTNSCGTATTSYSVSVSAMPAIGAISGPTSVCAGGNITLTDTSAGGTWTSSATSIATVSSSGLVHGIAAGTTIISYSITTSCGTATVTHADTVIPVLSAGTIGGATIVCIGSSITLTETSSGGSWTSGSTGVATVNSAGQVFGAATGVASITYTVSNSCGTAATSYTVTVGVTTSAGTITGLTAVCQGANITLTDTTSGGSWTSGSTGIATVSSSGVVHGVAAGTTFISYAVTTTCGTATVSYAVTVTPLPSAGTITGSATVCTGSNITLTDTTGSGSWTSGSTGVATVNSLGRVFGVTVGSASITYTVTNSCGTAATSYTVTVGTTPSAGTISGLSSVCEGANITLTDTTSGGTWTSGSTSNATVSSTGVVHGVAAGSAIISYSVTNGCGTSVATHTVTVNALPSAGTISGPTSLCTGANITLTASVSGGTWTSSASTLATTDTAGHIHGVATGVVTISYTVTTACGSATATHLDTVRTTPNAGAITGASSVCVGFSITLADTVTGGTWTASNATATVVGGVVTGAATGVDTIMYSLTNSCGTATARKIVAVVLTPDPGVITGLGSVCMGSTITLTESVSGGTWSSGTSSVATVSTSGAVTGLAFGTSVISYTVTTGCGTSYATHPVSVDVVAAATTGPDTVCATSTVTLANATAGGFWGSSNTVVATVSTSGVVYGVSAGTVNITYSVNNSCGTTTANHNMTVYSVAHCDSASGVPAVQNGIDGALSVYPNPANTGNFTVMQQSAYNEAGTITITSLPGEKIAEMPFTTNKEMNVNISTASGVYFITVHTAHGRNVTRIMITE